ncbi:LOW QUALITY PROTEIN: HERV-H LTR-associating protein 2 [Lycaon pictus]
MKAQAGLSVVLILVPSLSGLQASWSKVEKETSSILAYFQSSSNITMYEPCISWNKEQINRSDFSLTLKDLSLSDNGEYLCNISSSKYSLLTIQTLHVVGNRTQANNPKEPGIPGLVEQPLSLV